MLPPWRKRRFCRFSLIRGLGNAVFPVFRSSEASEMQFFLFFAHPRPRKRCFSRFPLIRGLGNAVFRVFRSSEASEMQFFAFSAHPRPRTDTKTAKFGIGHTTEKRKIPDGVGA